MITPLARVGPAATRRLLNWLLFYIHNFLPSYSHPQHDLKDRCGPHLSIDYADAKTYNTNTQRKFTFDPFENSRAWALL